MANNAKSWSLQEVADAHTRAALTDLCKAPQAVDPYRYFIEAMDFIQPKQPGATFLDIGCGCGQYGELCDRFYPQVSYYGTDVSPAMIANAKTLVSIQPDRFAVCEFEQNGFAHDIVMASSVLEYAGTWAALDLLLHNAVGWIILHRMRLTASKDQASFAFDEPTYAGHSEQHFCWNIEELAQKIQETREIGVIVQWARVDHVTIVVAPVAPPAPKLEPNAEMLVVRGYGQIAIMPWS